MILSFGAAITVGPDLRNAVVRLCPKLISQRIPSRKQNEKVFSPSEKVSIGSREPAPLVPAGRRVDESVTKKCNKKKKSGPDTSTIVVNVEPVRTSLKTAANPVRHASPIFARLTNTIPNTVKFIA